MIDWRSPSIQERMRSTLGVTRLAFHAASRFYGAGIAVWSKAWDLHVLSYKIIDIPVISIGSLTAGGSGKTPIALNVAARLAPRRVLLVSRGYGGAFKEEALEVHPLSPWEEVGDEALMMARRLPPSALVAVGAARHRVIEHFQKRVEVAVLDDGFQHRRLHRDLDIVVVNPGPFPDLLPLGDAREKISALARADLVWIHGQGETAEEVKRAIRAPVVRSVYRPAGIFEICVEGDGRKDAVETARFPSFLTTYHEIGLMDGARIFLLTTIARPQRVQALCRAFGAQVIGGVHRGDHQAITKLMFRGACARAKSAGADALLMTEKDALKVNREDLKKAGLPLWILAVEVQVVSGEERLERMLNEILSRSERKVVMKGAAGDASWRRGVCAGGRGP